MQDGIRAVTEQLGLTAPEHHEARMRIAKLSEKGCEARILGELLAQWKGLRGTLLVNGREIHLNAMDDWDGALKGLKPKDLADLGPKIQHRQEDLKELRATLASLHRTRLVQRLSASASGKGVHQIAIVVGEATAVLLEALELYRTIVLPRIVEGSHEIGPK